MPRRAVLGAALLGVGSLALTGCGIHLEEDAPRIPLVPTRTPVPGEADLLALMTQSSALAVALPATGARGAEFAAQHVEQAAVLDSALRRGGVPESLLTAPAAADSRSVGDREVAQVALIRSLLTTADPALLPTLASLGANRAVVCRVLKATIPHADTPSPSGPPATVPYLLASRAAAYGMEVVAARAAGDFRTRAIDALDEIRALALEQEVIAGKDAPPAITAYSLPLSADDEASARRLVEYLLGGLVTAYAQAIGTAAAGTKLQRADVLLGAGWLEEAALLADAWKVPLTAFPGLAQPTG